MGVYWRYIGKSVRIAPVLGKHATHYVYITAQLLIFLRRASAFLEKYGVVSFLNKCKAVFVCFLFKSQVFCFQKSSFFF